MPCRLLAVTFAVRDPQRLAAFWAELLGREAAPDGDGVLLGGDPTQVGLGFAPAGSAARSRRTLHLHLTSAQPGDQQATVDRVLALGGRRVDVGQLPHEDHVVVADPEGHPFGVIEAGNRYLTGTGFLGEVACDGTREVGVFWSEALGWPLVWDQDGETAVQSLAGGTKIAWGGPPVAPKNGPNPQWFDLLADDPEAEAERLVGLGATRAGPDALTDPDGNELRLSAASR